MPPRGIKKATKRARQYEHIKESERRRGVSMGRAEEIAARTVNKERARSRTSRAKGRTFDELYNEAKRMKIPGRSKMTKAQLQRAVDGRRR